MTTSEAEALYVETGDRRYLSMAVDLRLTCPRQLPAQHECRSCRFRTYSKDCSVRCPRCGSGMEVY